MVCGFNDVVSASRLKGGGGDAGAPKGGLKRRAGASMETNASVGGPNAASESILRCAQRDACAHSQNNSAARHNPSAECLAQGCGSVVTLGVGVVLSSALKHNGRSCSRLAHQFTLTPGCVQGAYKAE